MVSVGLVSMYYRPICDKFWGLDQVDLSRSKERHLLTRTSLTYKQWISILDDLGLGVSFNESLVDF